MPSKKIALFAFKGARTLSVVLASSCLIYVGQGAYAAGLGKLTVLSALGQPLRAEIELTSVTKADVGNLNPKLADYADFVQARVEYSPVLSLLRFAVEDRGSRHFVLITSAQPVNEPYMELLIELNSSSGRLIREYPMLLDVTGMKTNPAASSMTGATTPNDTFVLNQQPAQQSSYYQVKSGDTLGEIAKQVNYQGVSLDQMLVALQRSNPSALIDKNMNLVRSGVILTIPTIDEVGRIDRAEAKKIVLAQAIDFNAYRERLVNQTAQASSENTMAGKKIDGGKITAKVIETPTPVNESKDKLKLSKAQTFLDSGAEEEKIAQQKALEIAAARVRELEKNTANLQKVLDLHDEVTSTPPSTSDSTSAKTPTDKPELAASTSKPLTLPAIESNTPALQPKSTVPAKGISSQFVDNWLRYLPYGALLIGLFLAFGIYLSKRKRKIEHLDDEFNANTNEHFLLDSRDGQAAASNPSPDFDVSHSEQVEQENGQWIQVETTKSQEKNAASATHGPESFDLGTSSTAHTALGFDLSGIDLELPKLTPKAPQVNSTALQGVDLQEESVENNLHDIVSTSSEEEISVKLDLAVAYQKIGDKEGARELVEEILKSGNEEQAARANAMMRELV